MAESAQHLSYIAQRGREGVHVLFDPELIRSTFIERKLLEDTASTGEGYRRVRRALEELAKLGSLTAQRRFITALPTTLQREVCYYYFEWLDHQADSSLRVWH